MTYCIRDWFDNEIAIKPRLELYSVNDFMGKELPGLAIILENVTYGEDHAEEYDCLTVSFGEFIGMKNCAYIDTNNCPFASELLDQGIAQDTGFTKQSGFCEYPLWQFSEESLKEMGEENYAKYSEAYDNYMASVYGDDEDSDIEEDEGMTM